MHLHKVLVFLRGAACLRAAAIIHLRHAEPFGFARWATVSYRKSRASFAASFHEQSQIEPALQEPAAVVPHSDPIT